MAFQLVFRFLVQFDFGNGFGRVAVESSTDGVGVEPALVIVLFRHFRQFKSLVRDVFVSAGRHLKLFSVNLQDRSFPERGEHLVKQIASDRIIERMRSNRDVALGTGTADDGFAGNGVFLFQFKAFYRTDFVRRSADTVL